MKETKPVIVISAYGTGEVGAQKDLENIDSQVRQHFPGYEVRWAFTAEWLIKRLEAAGQTTIFTRQEPVKNLAGLYEELKAAGKTNVAIQCLMVQEGSESQHVYETPSDGLHVEYGKPLIEDPANIDKLIKAISSQFGGEGDITIVFGHGNKNDPKANLPFQRLDEKLRADYRDVYVTMIYGSPSPDEVFPKEKRPEHKRVVLVPIMITKGEHISNEILGDQDSSFKSRLGLPYTLAPSLSQTPAVMEIYMESLENLLTRF
ncbi:MAG: sirohydrochlorin cobaltochelatase [Dehalococcoidales bacterium]